MGGGDYFEGDLDESVIVNIFQNTSCIFQLLFDQPLYVACQRDSAGGGGDDDDDGSSSSGDGKRNGGEVVENNFKKK